MARQNQLTITPAPFKSSPLAIPPSPFSPRLPVTPPATPPKPVTHPHTHNRTPSGHVRSPLIPPPAKPLHWLWQCHQCGRTYKLATTRRCLDDGHFFCAGTTTVRRRGQTRVRRHKPCASEFDYAGWKAWSTWRSALRAIEEAERCAQESVVSPLFGRDSPSPDQSNGPSDFGADATWCAHGKKSTKPKKDCWNGCSYPSECRWGKQFGVQTPTLTVLSNGTTTTKVPKTEFDHILKEKKAEEADVLAVEAPGGELLADLIKKAKKRKSRSGSQMVPSPLACNPPESSAPPAKLEKGEDVEMTDVDLADEWEATNTSVSQMAKAFDDFEFDFKKSFEKANGLVSSVVKSLRDSAALEEEKAELFVRSLRIGKKKQG